MSPGCESRKRDDRRPSGFAFVVAAPLWHVRWSKCTSAVRSSAGPCFDERNSAYIYIYIRGARARVRGAGTRSKTPCGAGYLHIKVTMVSLELRYPSIDHARGREFSSHSGLSPIYSFALEWMIKRFSFMVPRCKRSRLNKTSLSVPLSSSLAKRNWLFSDKLAEY